MTSWAPHGAGRGRQETPSRASARTNSAAATSCPATLAIADPARPSPTG